MKFGFKKFAVILSACVSIYGFAYADSKPGGCTIAGPENAVLTIEEYSDFECPYCAKGSEVMKQVLKDYDGKVKLVFRNLPLPFHKNAEIAAKAFTAVCLQSPSLAHSFQTTLFANQDKVTKEGETYIFKVAKKLGVDVSVMKADMQGPKVAEILADDKAAADSHNFKGTPSFMIGSEAVVGARPYTEFKRIIDRQLGL
ncbi:DsbA family protein [Bdellovibrio sp. HCB337]|uniref:DsbA family protein n=1 Tax=Bdellovibrio sp. HCB337 TaxID=3394358 RepID=UPI0039A4F2AD